MTEEKLEADRIGQLRSLPIDLSLKELTDQDEFGDPISEELGQKKGGVAKFMILDNQ